MARFVIRLDPRRLDNPDLDIRYVLPDLLAERSGGIITDDGYDYAAEEPSLLLFLQSEDVERALACIVDVIERTRVLENDLHRAVRVAIETGRGHEVIYPPDDPGPFLPGSQPDA
ncbi:hypothetical protein [Aquisphaera insulae]|uniref:hypothetical protein n=1 Tax=Aquisphaera insulae TaxID=2712864 RepID=UPI0013EBA967|nr:hypothetical protein [Aquisphaera insulae]